MTVRVAYPATQSAGDVLTSANFTKLPGGWIGHVAVTANQTLISAVVDLTGLTVTVTVNTTRRIKISGIGTFLQVTSGGASSLSIYEGATQLTTAGWDLAAAQHMVPTPWCILTPSAGSHTYKLRAQTSGGTITLEASATQPAELLVEDVGPAT